MLKKTITYEDFDGNQRTEDFRFNISKAEVLEMQSSINGGMSTFLEKIIGEQDSKQLIEYFKDLILKSYGEKSLDGKHFIKSKELSEAFSQTEAYTELFMELAFNAEAASNFVNAVLPKNMSKQ